MTKTSEDAMERLRQFLEKLATGLITEDQQPDLLSALYHAWDKIEGGAAGSMTKDKVDRAKSIEWKPPMLSFVIERHGAFVRGSNRAELVGWNVDVSIGKATNYLHGHRELRPKDKKLDVKELVSRIVALLSSEQACEALTRKGDSEIEIHVGALIPDEGPKQTAAGRRKRFRTELIKVMGMHGWVVKENSRPYLFVRELKSRP